MYVYTNTAVLDIYTVCSLEAHVIRLEIFQIVICYKGGHFPLKRTDSCDERRVYKSEDISGPKGDAYMFDTSPKSLDLCLSKDV